MNTTRSYSVNGRAMSAAEFAPHASQAIDRLAAENAELRAAIAAVVHPNRDDERDIRPWQPGDGDKRCQSCGAPNIIWYTDHDLWNRVMPDDGVLCIGCFIHRAEIFVGIGSVWAVLHELIPASDDFRRGLSAGQAIRARRAENREQRLRDGITALADEWDALDMGTGLYPEDSAHRQAHEARAESCADDLRALLNPTERTET